MFTCKCGKEYKQEKAYSKHIETCPYTDMDENEIIRIAEMIYEVNPIVIGVSHSKATKTAKELKITVEQSKKLLAVEFFMKYKKALWNGISVWKNYLLKSEYREFLKWLFKTYSKQIQFMNFLGMIKNEKVLYRFNKEHTKKTIESRISDSLDYVRIHESSDDFSFVNSIISGEVSIYYVIFNDYLATKWFGSLDLDLQRDLQDMVQIASDNILGNLKPKEFDELQKLANNATPEIF